MLKKWHMKERSRSLLKRVFTQFKIKAIDFMKREDAYWFSKLARILQSWR